jgi:hypothetical protein
MAGTTGSALLGGAFRVCALARGREGGMDSAQGRRTEQVGWGHSSTQDRGVGTKSVPSQEMGVWGQWPGELKLYRVLGALGV